MPRERRPRSPHPRALVLLSLVTLGCALPTPLGELPSTTAISATGDTFGSTSIGVGVSGTSVPPEMTSDTGIGEPPPPHGWAMRYDEWSTSGDTSDTSGMSGTSGAAGDGGPVISPDTLVVQLTTGPDDCDDPHAPLVCGGSWTLTMLIPPELQVPGTYDLLTELSAIATITGEEEGDDPCSVGVGMVEGTAELLEVSDLQVTGRLSMIEPFGVDPSGDFVAERCG